MVIAMSLCLAFTNCKKSEKGPKGDTGATGATGANGSANVQSITFMNQGFAWVPANTDYENVCTTNAITQNIMDNGLMLAYIQPSSAPNSWTAIPCAYMGLEFLVEWRVGSVTISSGANVGTGWNIKIVVVPPAMVQKYPNFNWNNYEAINNLMAGNE